MTNREERYIMKKILDKKEVMKSGSGVEYMKLHFGKQWFMVAPWHYEPAKLTTVLEACKEAVEGSTYDIKWRDAKVGGRKVTLLTSFTLEEEEFVWDGDEFGGDNTPESAYTAADKVLEGSPNQPHQEVKQHPLESHTGNFDPFSFDDEDDFPF